MSRGLSYRFNQKVKIEAAMGDSLRNPGLYNFELSAEDVSHTNIQAGAIAAGGAGLMRLIGTPILMPFISMAAFPFLQRQMLETKLRDAKAKIIPEVQEQFASTIIKLQNRLYSYIDTRAQAIASNTESGFEILLQNMRERIEAEVSDKEKAGHNLMEDLEVLNKQISELNDFLERC